MRFNDMRIRTKLCIGFGFVVTLTIVLVLFDLFFIKYQHEMLTKIVDKDSVKLILLSDMENVLKIKAIKLRDSIILNERSEIELTLHSIESDIKRQSQLKKQLESLLNAEDRPQFEKISEIHKSLIPLIDRMTPLMLKNRDAEAQRLLVAEFMPLQEKVLSLLDIFSLSIRNRLQADKNTEELYMKAALFVRMLFGLIAIILSVAFALLTNKSIVQPVSILTREAKKLERGELNLDLPFERKDEIGMLATTFNHAIKELQKHIEYQKELQFKLMNKEKLADIGELTAGIVHNLKNPMNAIIGFAEVIQRKSPEVESINYILDAGRDMERIIETILYKTRQEQATQETPIDINKILSNGLAFLEANPLFKHKVQKNIELEAALPKINGVYSDFSQSFSNIIKNALDAIYNSDTKTLTVKTWHDEKHIYVMVGDTGEGIAEEKLEKIFEPHFTTKATADEASEDKPIGNGLGLYMVRELLKKYQAEYDIKSQIGKGTTFTVIFPIGEQKCLS